MKHMRRIASLLLALVMVFAMATTAFADDAPTTGSITIGNATVGQTYTIYKLFDAQVSGETDKDGNSVGITYTVPDGKNLSADNKWFQEDPDTGFVTAKTGADITTDEFREWAKTFGTQQGDSIKATTTEVKFEGVPFGYYYVDSTLGAALSVTSTNPNATVQDKNNPPELEKKITAIDGASSDSINDDGDTAHVEVGDKVTYTVTITAKAGAENYVFTDTLSAGLTLDATSVKVNTDLYGDSDIVDNTTEGATSVSGNSIKITFTKDYLDEIKVDTDITITYDAIINENAVIGSAGNENEAKLEYGHDPADNYLTDDVTVYSAKITVTKTDKDNEPLAGAGFVLQNEEGKYYKNDNGVVTWVDSITDDIVKTTTSDENGNVLEFTGLADGEYTLIEHVVPDGYNKADDVDFTIEAGKYTQANLEQSATVINQVGSELPSTGGMGTTLFYVVGGIMVLAAVVLLVTKKRMGNAE